MTRERFDVRRRDGAVLVGERGGAGPTVVLLHAGVADRRSWAATADLLADDGLDLLAYDRRGYGDTPRGPAGFRHVDDLLAVLDAAEAQRAVLVGNSMGGALAPDLALTAPIASRPCCSSVARSAA